jgi:DNA-binding transcriptional LysR family regulator
VSSQTGRVSLRSYAWAGVIELRHLRYFIAVAEELNFSRAAERLHMAQPPLSVAIRQLEQELGTELLLRTSREVRLTEAGRAVLDGARKTLTELDRTIANATRAAAGDLGTLRIAFSWSARFDTLPKLGQTFRAAHPGVELLTEEAWNARIPQALRSGAIDTAISLCPEIVSDLAYQPIRRERIVALLAATHPLAAEPTIPLASLRDEQQVLFPRELAPRLHDTLIGICRSAGFEPTLRPESFHTGWELHTLADLPIVALAPESVAPHLPAGVVGIPLADPADTLETALVWHPDTDTPAATEFRALAATLFNPAT